MHLRISQKPRNVSSIQAHVLSAHTCVYLYAICTILPVFSTRRGDMYRLRAFLYTFGKLVAVEAGTAVTLVGVLADRQDVVRTMDAGASEGETVGEGDRRERIAFTWWHGGSFIVQTP